MFEHPTSNAVAFHDGATAYPPGFPPKMDRGPLRGWNPDNWSEAFYRATVVHDICYKAEPDFSGASKLECDLTAYRYTRQICDWSYKKA